MTIPELIEKLEKATCPDRELDEAISAALFPDHEFMQLKDAPEGVGSMMYRWPNGQQVSALRATSSIDAAVKLCELVLPGWIWCVVKKDIAPSRYVAFVASKAQSAAHIEAEQDRCAIALCIAVLRALQPKEGE